MSSATSTLQALRDQLRALAHPAEWAGRLGFKLDPWQADVLTTPKRRVILNCSRQSGKTEVAALKVLHTAITKPGATCLLYSPSLRQSGELFRRVLGPYRSVESSNPATRETVLRIELENGSRVIALPGSERTTRTYTADVVVVDEAARVPDAVFIGLRPMLAVSGGSLFLLSTPAGQFGHFAGIWTEGDPEAWHKVRITAPMLPGIALSPPEPDGVCPRIPLDYLEQERREMREPIFLSEFYGEFLEGETAAFSHSAIEAAMSSSVEPWDL